MFKAELIWIFFKFKKINPEIEKNPRNSRVFFLNLTLEKADYFSAAIEAIAASTPSIESAAFLIRASASTSTSSAVA